MSIRKVVFSLICILIMSFGIVGCGNNESQMDTVSMDASEQSATEDNASSEDAEQSEATDDTKSEDTVEGHYEFKPIVVASIFRDIMGEDMYDAYCNYVKAVQSGKDEFAVKDEESYDWMIGQFPRVCYPVLGEYTESNYADAFKNGKATFQYKIPKDELAKKESEFEDLVTGILNKTMRDDYSDIEKILALYEYFSTQYSYDYDMYEKSHVTYVEEANAYRFLTGGKGICSECAPAFSYLLLEAGVDATTAGGYSDIANDSHEWTYVTINGKNYHVDATYAMGSGVYLSYFMMTDEQREYEDGYKKDEMTVGCHYKEQANGKDYTADDDFFAPLWGGFLDSFDSEKNIIYYTDKEGNPATFDYSAFE